MDWMIKLLFVLHILACAVYVWDWYLEEQRLGEALIRLSICLCLPLAGVVFWKFVDYFSSRHGEAQMDELYLGNNGLLDDLSLLRPVNWEEEINKEPAVDTLQMGDYHLRRKMIMDTLKKDDTEDYLEVLKEALSNEDTETSHYASTVIMDLQKGIQEKLIEKERQLQKEPDNVAFKEELEKELFCLIQSGAFDESTMKGYCLRYQEISDELLSASKPKDIWYHNRIAVDLKTGENSHARDTAKAFVKAWPDREEAVTDMIQVCIKLKDRTLLDQFLAGLKQMPVVLTSQSLQYIRFLTQKEQA